MEQGTKYIDVKSALSNRKLLKQNTYIIILKCSLCEYRQKHINLKKIRDVGIGGSYIHVKLKAE